MEKVKVILLMCFFLLIGIVQGQNKGTILIISNNDTTIVVDGDEIGKTIANKPSKFEITEGEHYLQAKSLSNGTLVEKNEILEIISGQQKVIKFDFEQALMVHELNAAAKRWQSVIFFYNRQNNLKLLPHNIL